MHIRNLLTAVMAAALTAGVAVATPANAVADRPREAVTATATTTATVSSTPSPVAPHSGRTVPGLEGAAVRTVLPETVDQRFQDLITRRRGTAPAAGGAGTPAATSGTATSGAATSGVPTAAPSPLGSWSGALHTYWGVFPGPTAYGAQATQSLNPSASVGTGASGNSDIVYAPTLDPSALTCIEMSTIYTGGTLQIGAWDWCAASPGFAKTAVVDSTFLSTYSRTVNGQPFYSVQDVQTNATTNEWTSYLYNYTTSSWDTFFRSANTSKLSSSGGGWDMMEVYTYYDAAAGQGQYCDQTHGAVFETTGLQYQVTSGGAWAVATPAYASFNTSSPQPSDLGCQAMNYTVANPNSAFYMINPAAASQCTGLSAWLSSASYTVGTPVTYGGHKWTASQWSQGNTPGGAAGVWTDDGAC